MSESDAYAQSPPGDSILGNSLVSTRNFNPQNFLFQTFPKKIIFGSDNGPSRVPLNVLLWSYDFERKGNGKFPTVGTKLIRHIIKK